jgi:phospholipid/cholesterol/gamma-HCH transport system substrate-binding protein
MIRGKAIVACAIFAAILAATVYGLLIPKSSSSSVFEAEFSDAGLLTSGDDVVEYGAKVGSVDKLRLTSRGTALVDFSLFSGVQAPRADATVSVRPQNLLGGYYLSLQPGSAPDRLSAPIPAARTFVATQLNDIFNSYNKPTAAALNLLLDELGRALDARGDDLNRAVLQLAPTFAAADRLTTQLGQQNAHLADLVTHAQAVTSQVAPRTRDLDRFIVSLQQTLSTTADASAGLDRGLAQLPAALAQTRQTLVLLGSTAVAARPLAVQLGAAAPSLTTAVSRLAPFVSNARPAIEQLRPLVRQTASTLAAGRVSLPNLASSLGVLERVAPSLRAVSATVDPLVKIAVLGPFAGLGGIAGEPGTQPGDNEPGRNWFRGEGNLSCESFGVAIAPGCFATVLKDASIPPLGLPVGAPTARSKHTTAAGSGALAGSPRSRGNGGVDTLANQAAAIVKKLAGGTASTLPQPGTPSAPPSKGALPSLLKYLVGP